MELCDGRQGAGAPRPQAQRPGPRRNFQDRTLSPAPSPGPATPARGLRGCSGPSLDAALPGSLACLQHMQPSEASLPSATPARQVSPDQAAPDRGTYRDHGHAGLMFLHLPHSTPVPAPVFMSSSKAWNGPGTTDQARRLIHPRVASGEPSSPALTQTHPHPASWRPCRWLPMAGSKLALPMVPSAQHRSLSACHSRRP